MEHFPFAPEVTVMGVVLNEFSRPAVLVADMLVDFVSGALANPSSVGTIPAQARLLTAARKRGWLVCYLNDAHLPNDFEERLWGAHALAGTAGAQVIPELAPQPGDAQFAKRYYSGFYQTGLDMYLRQHGVETVILTGQHAHICVQHTAGDAFVNGYRIVLAGDAIAAFTPADHANGIAYIEQMYGGTTATVDEILGA